MNSKYFVLKPSGDDIYARASRMAMYRYAYEIKDVDHKLSDDIRKWCDSEINNVHKERSYSLGDSSISFNMTASDPKKQVEVEFETPPGWNSSIGDWIEGWGPNGKIQHTDDPTFDDDGNGY